MTTSEHYPEGSYWERFFQEFPHAIIRIFPDAHVMAYDKDGSMASTRIARPDDRRSGELWDWLVGIKDLM